MDVFALHRTLISQYGRYSKSFIKIADDRIRETVESELSNGVFWPEPLVQINPAYAPGPTVETLCGKGVLHKKCSSIFRVGKTAQDPGQPLQLYRHQHEAIELAQSKKPYVLTTGTGSGKSLAYIIPIVDHVLRAGSGRGIQAIIVYPMNALANSQIEELEKFLGVGVEPDLVRYARYTGQESEAEKRAILENPPDILLTNYVMLELILTRAEEKRIVRSASDLKFLVLDELHTYRGRQGADVSMLVRRCREAFSGDELLCVGTSATMASEEGVSIAERHRTVAGVSSRIFGAKLEPSQIVGETLERITPSVDFAQDAQIDALRASLARVRGQEEGVDLEELRSQPLASWIESSLGVRVDQDSGELVRAQPRPIEGAGSLGEQLAALLEVPIEEAEEGIRRCLELGVTQGGRSLFAFRLHQFITRGDTVYASLENPEQRELSLRPKRFAGDSREKRMYPLCFCRACGQEYYRVDRDKAATSVLPRERFEKSQDPDLESGYLCLSNQHPWPSDEDEVQFRLPVDWLEGEQGSFRVKRNRRDAVPQRLFASPDGVESEAGQLVAFVPAPFRFCLNPDCRRSFNWRQQSDLSKLATLGVDGRSTATTILGLAALEGLERSEALDPEARKILSFTDNRQDASLQAGHFNDFVSISLIRSGLYQALQGAGDAGIESSQLPFAIQNAIDAPLELFTGIPLRGAGREQAASAFRQVIEYNLYRDFQGGWRVVSPNLERCGLLEVEYLGLDELAKDQEYWLTGGFHGGLVTAAPEVRRKIIIGLLDHLRRNLCIKHEVLEPIGQERMSRDSQQWLADSWQISDPRELECAATAWDGSKPKKSGKTDLSLAKQSSFCQFLKRELELESDDLEVVTKELMALLAEPWGILECVSEGSAGQKGYRLRAGALKWHGADGTKPYEDPLRETESSLAAQHGNQYFREFYEQFSGLGRVFEGREHTAQVPADVREEREDRFRRADLPIMFCSPTMELGIDISQLNVVNMRNVPPTPANYAQRSGRAGRGGQPALVFTYCSGWSAHDQYYFRRPERMVAGAVAAPRLDLANEDLLRAHVHAIWLGESGLHLGKTLTEVLVVTEADLKLPVRPEIFEQLRDADARLRALEVSKRVLSRVEGISEASWWGDTWLEDIIQTLPQTFDQACNRWRALYRSAVHQRTEQNRIIGDHARPESDRRMAARLRGQAEAQIRLLTDARSAMEGDFYSYRYFASEGFLPGYNFPRLPISAFIPGRRQSRGRDEYLSRPRFLAISEFGPKALIYHEGRRYEVDRVNLAFDEGGGDLLKKSARLCGACGTCHMNTTPPPDRCVSCGADLDEGMTIDTLVQMQNVSARPRERITSNEEERRRQGYNVRTVIDMESSGHVQNGEIEVNGAPFGQVYYGGATTIYQINLGLRKTRTGKIGFLIDKESGKWQTTSLDQDDQSPKDKFGHSVVRVTPFVEDRRNALLLRPAGLSNAAEMATLQAALKQAVLMEFQLEAMEIAVAPLPTEEERSQILFYESAEGGAGALRQLLDDPNTFARVARRALEICHFDPESGAELAEQADCSRACDECLLDYGNQRDHDLLDRHLIRDHLLQLARSKVIAQGPGVSKEKHLQVMMEACDSKLEKRWLSFINENGLRLPSHAQYRVEDVGTKPDFYYQDKRAVVYIDGPPHDTDHQQTVDDRVTGQLVDAGYLPIRFHHGADWSSIVREYSSIFGELR